MGEEGRSPVSGEGEEGTNPTEDGSGPVSSAGGGGTIPVSSAGGGGTIPVSSAGEAGSIPAPSVKEGGNSPVSGPEEEGITFREAVLRLAISEKTLRARIKEGGIRAWQVEGKRGMEWRVSLPEGQGRDRGREDRDRDRPPAVEGREEAGMEDGRGRDEDRAPDVDLYRELLQRHEAATVRLGYLEARNEQMKMLQATASELSERATEMELKATQEGLERRKAQEGRRMAEQIIEELRRQLKAAETALEAERKKRFWNRLFRR